MTDESKVKTTFIRPVNRTMSYEDRRGYVYVCMYVKLLILMKSSLSGDKAATILRNLYLQSVPTR